MPESIPGNPESLPRCRTALSRTTPRRFFPGRARRLERGPCRSRSGTGTKCVTALPEGLFVCRRRTRTGLLLATALAPAADGPRSRPSIRQRLGFRPHRGHTLLSAGYVGRCERILVTPDMKGSYLAVSSTCALALPAGAQRLTVFSGSRPIEIPCRTRGVQALRLGIGRARPPAARNRVA